MTTASLVNLAIKQGATQIWTYDPTIAAEFAHTGTVVQFPSMQAMLDSIRKETAHCDSLCRQHGVESTDDLPATIRPPKTVFIMDEPDLRRKKTT